MKILLIPLILIFLTGCAANRYIVPESGPIANVTFQIKENSRSMQIFVFDDYRCRKPAVISSVSSKSYPQAFDVNIPANKPFIITYRIIDILSAEFVTTEFTPEEDQNYLIHIDAEKSTDIKTLEKTPEGLKVASTIVAPKKVCKW